MLPLPKAFTGDDSLVDPLNRMRTNIKDRTPLAGRNVTLQETPNGVMIHANVPRASGGSTPGGFALFKVVASGSINLGGNNHVFYACNKRTENGYEEDITLVRAACYPNVFAANGSALGSWVISATGNLEYTIPLSSPPVKWIETLNPQMVWQANQEIQANELGYSLGQITSGPYGGKEIYWVDSTQQPSWNHLPVNRLPICNESNMKLHLVGQIEFANINAT